MAHNIEVIRLHSCHYVPNNCTDNWFIINIIRTLILIFIGVEVIMQITL